VNNKQVGFLKEKQETITPIIPKEFTNGIVYGITGSGKTSCFIMPNVKDRIANEFGIVLFDFKGNMHLQVKHIAKEYNKLNNVIELGTSWGQTFNLFDKMSPQDIKNCYISFSKKTENDYWVTSSADLLESISQILKLNAIFKNLLKHYKEGTSHFNSQLSLKLFNNINSFQTNFRFIKNTISTSQKMTNFVSKVEENIIIFEKLLKEKISKELLFSFDDKTSENIKKNNSYYFKILSDLKNHYLTIEDYKNIDEQNNNSTAGKFGVLSYLNTTVSNTFTNDTLNNESEFDLIEAIENKKIIIINNSSLSQFSGILLNSYITKYLTKRTSNKHTKENITKVSIIIDEAHQIITKNTIPETSICRENLYEYIISVQNEELLFSSLGETNTKMFLKNIATQHSFLPPKTEKKDSIENPIKTQSFYYKKNNDEKINIATPLFFLDQELLETELYYQKSINILEKYVSLNIIEDIENTICIQDQDLSNKHLIKLFNIKNKKTTICEMIFSNEVENNDYFLFLNELEEEIKPFNQENSIEGLKEVESILTKYKNKASKQKEAIQLSLNSFDNLKKVEITYLYIQLTNHLASIESLSNSLKMEINETINIIENSFEKRKINLE
jgi:hypothetical protein